VDVTRSKAADDPWSPTLDALHVTALLAPVFGDTSNGVIA
jgi:hypothetical protein